MWNERYNTNDYIYGTNPNEFLVEQADQIPKGNVLCLADGEGRNSVFLAKIGHNVTAVDISQNAQDKAAKLADINDVNVNFICADLAEYNIEPNHWDAVILIFCHVPPELRKAIHQKVVIGLKDGGKILLEAYTPAQLNFKTGGPPSEAMMMSTELLKEEFRGLNFSLAEEVEREIIEGSFHTGLGAVVRVIAEKPTP